MGIPLAGLLASEWLKTRRTPARWLMWLTPPAMGLIILWYISKAAAPPAIWVKLFDTETAIWTTLCTPVGAGILAGLAARQELLAGHWDGLRSRPVAPGALYAGKLIVLLWQVAASTVLSGLLSLAAGLVLGATGPVPWAVFIASDLLILAAILPILVLQQWIAVAWGFGASVATGGAGLLVAALLGATNLGNTIWRWVPWAWPVRLAYLPVPIFCLPGMAFDQTVPPRAFLVKQAVSGTVTALILAALLTITSLIWFSRWEGHNRQE